MPEKVGFWKRMNSSTKLQVLFFCVSMVVITALYLPTIFIIKQSKEKELIEKQSVVTDYNIMLDIESVQTKAGKMLFEGWVLRLDSKNISSYLILQEANKTTAKVLYAKLEDRTDIKRHFGENYSLCGYNASILTSKLSEGVCYEIQMVLTYEQRQSSEENSSVKTESKKIATNYYLLNGELYNYNPLEFSKPKVEATEINMAIEKGTLHLYSHEQRLWVYEYDGKLFYILDPNMLPSLDRRPSIPIMMYTARRDLVPEELLDQYLEKGYIYQEKYLSESDYVNAKDPYYLVVVDLPTEYPISYILSGIYSNKEIKGWIYKRAFQMKIEIN